MQEITKKCISIILNNEGGYVNHPNDPGGETKYGISKRAFPHLDIKNLTKDQAIDIYHKKYWQPMNLDMIEEDELKLHLFDQGVNSGTKRAVKLLQKELSLVADGIIGNMTASAVNGKFTAFDYKRVRKSFYIRLAEKPKMGVFLKGWLYRVEHTHL
jgi:lysozyme family protein